jgi:hypothetical protein
MIARCKEPGCPLPADARYEGHCWWCWHSPHCERCHQHIAARGNLCRGCATELHPDQLYFKGRWRSLSEAVLRIVRDPAMRGVTFGVEAGRIVGRDGRGFVIVFYRELWKPQPQ